MYFWSPSDCEWITKMLTMSAKLTFLDSLLMPLKNSPRTASHLHNNRHVDYNIATITWQYGNYIFMSYSFPTGKAFSLVIHNSKKHRCPWLKRSVTGELYNHVTVCTVYTLYSSKPVEQQWGMQTKCINHRKPSWYKLYCVKIAWWWLAVSSLYLKWR